MKRGALIASLTAGVASLASGAHAAAVGAPVDGGLDLQTSATEVMSQIHDFHSFLLAIIVAITLFVLALLLWVIVRYNRRANPTPHKFTHNMMVEVIWTVVPVLILVAIAWKSFPLLYAQERVPQNAEITLKVVGNSWFWNFEYPDQGVAITANLLPEDQARAENRPYLLATTEPLPVPADTTVRVLVTSNDVIHSFGVPALGVKEDAIQGRVNEAWFNIDSERFPPGSVLYGNCYELCGVNHAYMPIELRVVTRAEWEQWITSQGGTLATAEPETATEPATAPAEAPPGEPAAPAQPAPAAQPTR